MSLLISDVTIGDRPGRAVHVVDGRIAWLGDTGEAPSADRVVAGEGALLTPAFVDAHVHATATGLARTGLDLTPLWHRETNLRGCYAYRRDDFATAAGLVADLGLGRLVTATYPLARYEDAVAHAAAAGARGAVKIAFDARADGRRTRP